MAVELMKRQVGQPYIEASEVGGVIAGTKNKYIFRWPPQTTLESASSPLGVELLNLHSTSPWEYGELERSVENDPAIVEEKGMAAEESLETRTVKIENLGKEGSSIEHTWPELGTYTVRCKSCVSDMQTLEPNSVFGILSQW
jgi:hypothetical protein